MFDNRYVLQPRSTEPTRAGGVDEGRTAAPEKPTLCTGR